MKQPELLQQIASLFIIRHKKSPNLWIFPYPSANNLGNVTVCM